MEIETGWAPKVAPGFDRFLCEKLLN